MGSAIKWGIILALAVSVFSAIWVLAGMHTNMPAAMGYLGVVILLNIAAVIMALRESASQNGYGGQLAAGVRGGPHSLDSSAVSLRWSPGSLQAACCCRTVEGRSPAGGAPIVPWYISLGVWSSSDEWGRSWL